MTPDERRRAERTTSEFALEIYNADGQRVSGESRLVNVSETGARFETTARLVTGHTIRARVQLEKDAFLELPARIVWMRSQGDQMSYGLEFSEVAPQDIQQLKTRLNARRRSGPV